MPVFLDFPCGSAGKESACDEGDLGWEDPLEKERLPTPVSWFVKFHELYGPWGHKESDMTERLSLSNIFHFFLFSSICTALLLA